MSDDMDMADHLVAAAKQGLRDGLTKEQFRNNADVFWDSWEMFAKLAEESARREP